MTQPVLAFAVVDADVTVDGVAFFDLPLQLVGRGPVAAAYVPSHGEPAAEESTLLAHHEVVSTLSERGGCLPHRFGLVADLRGVVADLEVNGSALSEGLDIVRGRQEVLVRSRIRPDDVVLALDRRGADVRTKGDAIEVGRHVHELTTSMLAADVDAAVERLRETVGPAVGELHGDGLGADITALVERSAPVSEEAFELLLLYAEVEMFDPTPCYRTANRLIARLRDMP